MTQEQIYDEKITPIMAQITQLCEEHRIPFIACFACPSKEDRNLRAAFCFTGPHLIGVQHDFHQAARVLSIPGLTLCDDLDEL